MKGLQERSESYNHDRPIPVMPVAAAWAVRSILHSALHGWALQTVGIARIGQIVKAKRYITPRGRGA